MSRVLGRPATQKSEKMQVPVNSLQNWQTNVRDRPGSVPGRLGTQSKLRYSRDMDFHLRPRSQCAGRPGTKEFLGNAENWKFPLFQNSNACNRPPRPRGSSDILKILESSRCMPGDCSLVPVCGVDRLGQGVYRAYCVQ